MDAPQHWEVDGVEVSEAEYTILFAQALVGYEHDRWVERPGLVRPVDAIDQDGQPPRGER